MLTTGAQLRGARAMLRLEQEALAERSGVSLQTIRRVEKADGRLADVTLGTLRSLSEALAGLGVTFPGGEDGGGVVVRLALATAPAPRRRA